MSDDLLSGFQRLIAQTRRSFHPAMKAGANVIEPAALDGAQRVIVGMSGAAFASLVAYVADREDDGTFEIVSAYNAAAGRLANFTGHQGQPYLADVPGPGDQEVWIVLTVPTDYIDRLVIERDDFLGDAGYQQSPQAFNAVVAALRAAWHP